MGSCSKNSLGRTNTCIVEAARQVFLRQGYENASMDSIARQADVSKATVYAHFAGKEALFIAVMQNLRDEYHERLAGIAQKDEGGFADRLRLALSAVLDFLIQADTMQMFRIIVAETHRFPDIALDSLRSGREKSERVLAEIFAGGVETGELNALDCQKAAHFTLIVLRGGLVWEKLLDAGMSISKEEIGSAVDNVVATVTKLHERPARG